MYLYPLETSKKRRIKLKRKKFISFHARESKWFYILAHSNMCKSLLIRDRIYVGSFDLILFLYSNIEFNMDPKSNFLSKSATHV